ncbi:MAG TPA: ankyrin repeat domain-containing protein, partial [Bacteroidales bacterium]|nr:ankyrin repeat domain-containing protein [Bacteroidales bacterium]
LGDRENSMPIHLAAISGSIESIDLLLTHGVDIDIRDDNGMTPLLFSLSRGQRDAASHLIDEGADIGLRSNSGWGALHLAVATRSDEISKRLLDMGARVNVKLESGATPLHSAVSFGNTEMVKMLVEKGADINAETEHGDQPLSWAINPNTYDAMVYLIGKGADINHRSSIGQTAMHNIAGRGAAFDNAKLLMEKGADIDAQDDWGRTPLYLAAYSNNPGEMSKFLILHGADVNPSNCMDKKTCACFPNFSTPLHVAARQGNLEMTKNLVASGARVNIFNHEGQTPLHCAVMGGNAEIVEYLLDQGSFINVQEEKQGSSELHLAVAMGYNDITGLLTEHGANPDIQDDCGKTPLDYAMYYGHKEMGYNLLAGGANDVNLAGYLTANDELDEKIPYGEAKVWFLGHSSWAVKTQNHFLVFDYFCNTWDRKADDSCLASGCIIPAQIQDQQVTVFSTHNHGDHYDSRIFNWKEVIPDINYVLCWEQNTNGNEYTLVPIHEQKVLDDMKIYAHHATDLGGGYLVEVDGITILHMGDHANGEDGLMPEFTAEIDMIKARTGQVDILFGGIRGCSLGEPEQVKKGIYYTLETLNPGLFVPMHAGAHAFAYKDFVETAKADGIRVDMKYVVHKGDRFKYSPADKEEVSSL